MKKVVQGVSVFTEKDYLGARLCRVSLADVQERVTSIRNSPAKSKVELIFQSKANTKEA